MLGRGRSRGRHRGRDLLEERLPTWTDQYEAGELLPGSIAYQAAELHHHATELLDAIATEALQARGPLGWYARLLLRLSRKG